MHDGRPASRGDIRRAGTALAGRWRGIPAVVPIGPRQAGKRTLAEHLVPGERRWRSLHDLDGLDASRRDPESLGGMRERLSPDAVRRAPDLLSAVTLASDRDHRTGWFVLSGSAKLRSMRRASESLSE